MFRSQVRLSCSHILSYQINDIMTSKMTCFILRVNFRYQKAGMEMVKLRDMEDWETLPLTKWNIKQPYLKDVRENALDAGKIIFPGIKCQYKRCILSGLDLLIVPGVAFTKDGLRLGHGGGYYDRYQNKLREIQEVPPATIAVAFKEQVVDEVPTEDTDVTIDLVLYAD